MLSTFEMARGYTPALFGLPKRPINVDIVSAHQEPDARRALRKLVQYMNPNVAHPDD